MNRWQGIKKDIHGGVPVSIQDQTSEVIDLYACRTLGTATTPTQAQAIGDSSIIAASVDGASAGKCIDISENGRMFQAIIASVSESTVNFSVPLDMDITTSAIVRYGEWNMQTSNASPASPDIYFVGPPAGVTWDVVRILLAINDDLAMDDAKFGGITALTNGILLRVVNGIYKNIFTCTNNGGLAERMYEVSYIDATLGPAGQYALRARRTFAGQDKNGVALRLHGDTGDQIQMVIQDNLTELTKFVMVVQGHVVQEG